MILYYYVYSINWFIKGVTVKWKKIPDSLKTDPVKILHLHGTNLVNHLTDF